MLIDDEKDLNLLIIRFCGYLSKSNFVEVTSFYCKRTWFSLADKMLSAHKIKRTLCLVLYGILLGKT